MKSIKENSYSYYYKIYKNFLNKFGSFCMLYKYIVIVDDFLKPDEEIILEEKLSYFMQKYDIHELALGVLNYSKKKFPNVNVHLFQITEAEIKEIINLYQFFPICNELKIISLKINGRILNPSTRIGDMTNILLL